MRHLERHAGQRAGGLIAEALVAADPVLALVLALVVAAPWKHRIALDRLPLERLAFGGPILERAGFEVEIERLAVGADGKDAFVILLGLSGFLTGRDESQEEHQGSGSFLLLH